MKRLFNFFILIGLYMSFFGIVTPISMLFRLFGHDVLNLRLSRTQKSYWIERTQPKLISKGFFTQFISK